MFKRIIIPLLLILFMASMVAFGVEDYGNVGPTTEFNFDIKIEDEIIAEGSSADEHETTIFFTDPTADRTITIPDADVVVGVVAGIVPPDHGGTGVANNVASTITITGAFATTITVTNVTAITLPTSGIIVSDATACTDIEGTYLSIAAGVLNVSGLAESGANVDITSILNVGLYVGRDADNFISWAVDDTLTIEIANVSHGIVDIETGAGDNDSLVTQGYCDDNAAAGGANVALSNLAGVAINASLITDTADTYDLGSATFEYLTLYLGTYGTVYFGIGQTESIAETAVNALLITATDGVSFSDEIWTTNIVGRDTDNYIGWDVDDTLKIKIGGVLHSIVSITDGVGDNDKLATQGYVDDQVAGANVNLSNLAAVAINTSLLSDAADTDSLGSATKEWLSLFLGDAGKIFLGLGQTVELYRSAANTLTITASTAVLLTGPLGVTGTRVSKGWFTDVESTNDITIGGTALAAIYANLGANTDITSLTNAALIIGRDADNTISFITDDTIIFETAGAEAARFTSAAVLLLSGNLDINEYAIDFSDDLNGDHDYSGITDAAAVGENVVFGDFLYFDWTQTEWMKAQADAYATSRAERIALETKGDGDTCLMLIIGYIRDDSAFDFGASAVFLNDDTAGAVDDTAPAEAGDQIQVVGNAISADIMFFNPSQDIGEI